MLYSRRLLVSLSSRRALLWAAFCIGLIAVADWLVIPNVSLGFLYFLPLILSAGRLRRGELLALSLVCAVFKEQFSGAEAWRGDIVTRFLITSVAYLGSAFYVRETARLREAALAKGVVAADEIRRREAAEQQLRSFLEGSPAAIVTTDKDGLVVLSNEAAQEMLCREGESLAGAPIEEFLPTIGALRQTSVGTVRTSIECTGYRRGGEPFSAQVWVSNFGAAGSGGLGIVIFDSSEQLRTREEGRLQSLTASARVILGSFWHETRNFCAALRVSAAGLRRIPGVADAEEMSAILSLIGGLERMSVAELRPQSRSGDDSASLHVTLDHLRVIVEPLFRDSGIAVEWKITNHVLLVRGDQHAYLQVFLNLARNAMQALKGVPAGKVVVEAKSQAGSVLVTFANNGPPVLHPETLFRPFQAGAQGQGIGLFVSREIVRCYGGDLSYGSQDGETRFTVRFESATWLLDPRA